MAQSCPHCASQLSEDNDTLKEVSHIRRSNQLMTHTMIAMTLFVAGMAIWFWGGEPAEGLRATIGGIFFALGFIGYLVTRIRMVLHKRKSV